MPGPVADSLFRVESFDYSASCNVCGGRGRRGILGPAGCGFFPRSCRGCELFTAARDGNLSSVTTVLAMGVEAEQRPPQEVGEWRRIPGATELAAKYGHHEILRCLLQARARLTDEVGCAAIRANRSNCVKTLMESRCHPQTLVYPALQHPVRSQSETMLSLLINAKADVVDERITLWVAQHGTNDALATIVKFKANPASRRRGGSRGETPLLQAATSGRDAMVVALLDLKCDPSEADKDGKSIFVIAAEKPLLDTLQHLLAHKNSTERRDSSGMTPLVAATHANQTASVKLLLSSKASPSYGSRSGAIPLFWAISNASTVISEELLNANADPNTRFSGEPAILKAIQKAKHEGNSEILAKLLQARADPNVKDQKGERPIFEAVCTARDDVVQMLLDAKADPHVTNKRGLTPHMLALEGGATHTSVANILSQAQRSCPPVHPRAWRGVIGRALHTERSRASNARPPVPAPVMSRSRAQSSQSTEGAHVPSQGWDLTLVTDAGALAAIASLFRVQDASDLGVGRDVREQTIYKRLQVVSAWEIDAPDRSAIYSAKKSQVARELNAASNVIDIPMVATKLQEASAGFGVDSSVNEVVLLHGTKPEHVLTILQNGLNERFSGGLFGKGVYCAEDPAKIDQYCTADFKRSPSGPLEDLHRRLYVGRAVHPGKVFYALVCRTILGVPVHTKDGIRSICDSKETVFATADQRELATIPRSAPPIHYHALIAETGGKIQRHREFVIFDGDRISLDYLVAYTRV